MLLKHCTAKQKDKHKIRVMGITLFKAWHRKLRRIRNKTIRQKPGVKNTHRKD